MRFLFGKDVVKSEVWMCKNPPKNTLCNDFHCFWFIT